MHDPLPLCIDLDHTLIKTDLLYETLILFAKRNPLALLAVPWWLLKGRPFLKSQLATRVQLQIARLPFRQELVAFLHQEKKRNRPLILVSASSQTLASAVADHLHLFDEVIASNETENVKGSNKARLLEQRFGKGGFDYIGDAKSDLAVWRSAHAAMVVTNSGRFVDAIRTIVPVERVFSRSVGYFSSLLRALRIHQWSKNFLVFVPAITAHRVFEIPILANALLAWLSFSLFSSGVYLVNDLLDLEADRQHPTKCLRPLATGEFSIVSALLWTAVLFGAGIGLAFFCGKFFLVILIIYGVGNLAYSLWLKRIVMLDVIVLACFYSLRLLAGGAATGIGCSEWLLAFSVFFFFCLAMIKRYSELRSLLTLPNENIAGRGYSASDLETVAYFGVSSGLISVLVLVLYVMSPEVRLVYRHPAILLLLCPLLLYWITRIWFKARRGEVPQDPVVFALTDWISYIAGAMAALVLYAAIV